ncbi:EamA family transporter [Paenibacillus harenae]|uniref:Drug/metabolite transporter (DMT)-like permease n=1 Tax=Paenibacillus harenae TaxID=306543 RepID=A0ABT9U209_PAEHA|nr:DMT family transporter [Paenibacillus harenae]MDQ0113655.1 drug/metabolite transporter (DMT)-like permease [Paenibacillus harenae]
MKQSKSYWFSVIIVLFGAACYGILSPIVKLAYDAGFSFEQITVHQIGISVVLLWLLVLLRPKLWRNPFRRGKWIMLAIVGIFGLCLTTVFYNMALQRLEASFSIVLLFQFMWITILLECLRIRRFPRKLELAAIAVAMAGTLLAAGLFEEAGLARMDWIGVGYGLASAVTYSLFLFLTGLIDTDHDPVMKSAMMMSFGFIAIALLYGSGSWAGEAEWEMLGWGTALALLGSVLPAICFNAGIPKIGSGLASLLGAVELPVAVVSAWLFINEKLSSGNIIGIILILIGIAVAEHSARRTTVRTERLEE